MKALAWMMMTGAPLCSCGRRSMHNTGSTAEEGSNTTRNIATDTGATGGRK